MLRGSVESLDPHLLDDFVSDDPPTVYTSGFRVDANDPVLVAEPVVPKDYPSVAWWILAEFDPMREPLKGR
jgi:hypothetical protein